MRRLKPTSGLLKPVEEEEEEEEDIIYIFRYLPETAVRNTMPLQA
jgi:hypothetical protein